MVYVDLVALLNFLIDFLLLLGANQLCGYPPVWHRMAIAAGAGGIYAGVCLLPGFRFLGNMLWKLVSMVVIIYIAFGLSKSAMRRGVIFALLSMALGGIAMAFGDGGILSLIAAAVAIAVMCVVGFRGRVAEKSYIPIELSYGGKCLRLTALQDTGNMLRDPITGRPILVICSEAAQKLTGLTLQQLQSPVQALTDADIPGLRLIPYKAVGQPGGVLLALRLQRVKIGKWEGNSLVAFAPSGLSDEGAYQALTGGIV